MSKRRGDPVKLIGLALAVVAAIAIVNIVRKHGIGPFLQQVAKTLAIGAALAFGVAWLMRALAIRIGLAFLAPWLAAAAAVAAFVISGGWNAAAAAIAPGAAIGGRAAGLASGALAAERQQGPCANPNNWTWGSFPNGRVTGVCINY